jgi:transglutaminase-like putative cysteine protease
VGASDSVDMSSLRASGRRIGVASLVVAVLLPVLLPGFTTGLLNGNGLGSGPGDATLSFRDPMVSLANDLQGRDTRPLLYVSTNRSPSYLRMAVLNRPGPTAWRVSSFDLGSTIPVADQLPPPVGQAAAVASTGRRSMRVTPAAGFPKDSAWLPVPFGLRDLNVSRGEWGYLAPDETVVATSTDSMQQLGDSPYQAVYSESDPTRSQLENAGVPPPDIVKKYGWVPAAVPLSVRQTAQQVTSAGSNDYEKALLLQSFFRDPKQFTYDVHTGYGAGYQAMAEFLLKRRGYCQHFAATMAMMARTIGIPSRVVVGFLEPAAQLTPNDYVFTSHDVHAWPELYFSGVGWVRFEPTHGNGAVIPSWAPSIPLSTSQPTASNAPSLPFQHPTGSVRNTGTTSALGAGSTGGGNGGGAAPSKVWLFVLLAVAVLFAPGLARWGVRRARLSRPIDGTAAAEAAWSELRDHMRDLSLPWTGSMTPRARARTVEPLLAGDVAGLSALGRLSLSVERARYAASPMPGATPAADVKTVMDGIDKGVEWQERLRALLLPRSLLPDIRAAWRRAADGRRRAADERRRAVDA